jgi:hypothetical protein
VNFLSYLDAFLLFLDKFGSKERDGRLLPGNKKLPSFLKNLSLLEARLRLWTGRETSPLFLDFKFLLPLLRDRNPPLPLRTSNFILGKFVK